MARNRLWAVSLLLENPLGRTQRRKQHKRAVVSVWAWHAKTRAASSVARLPTPALLAAHMLRSQSHSHASLFCVLSLGFSSKRETARSLGANCLQCGSLEKQTIPKILSQPVSNGRWLKKVSKTHLKSVTVWAIHYYHEWLPTEGHKVFWVQTKTNGYQTKLVCTFKYGSISIIGTCILYRISGTF